MSDMNKHIKKFYLGGDARSTRGILSRGTNVYGASGSNAPNTGTNLRKAALKRLGVKK